MDDEAPAGVLDVLRDAMSLVHSLKPVPVRWDIDTYTYDYLRRHTTDETARLYGDAAVLAPFTTMVVLDWDLPPGCCGVEFSDGHYENYTY